MKLNDIYKRSMPYPIYGRKKDYVNSHKTLISDSVKIVADGEMHKFSFKLEDFGTAEFAKLVESGLLKCVCEVDCQSGMYRNSFYSENNGSSLEFDFSISRRVLTGRAEFLVYLVSVSPIAHFEEKVKGLNSIYSGRTINIETGYCIALLGQGHYDFDIEYDKLQNAGSFMKVRRGNKPIPYCDLSQTMIYINLPEKMYSDFKEYDNRDKSTAGAVYLSSFVLNFLVQAIMEMQQKNWYLNDSPNNPMWARAICYKMTHSPEYDMKVFEDMQISDAIELAQRLLGNPYGAMFDILKRNND